MKISSFLSFSVVLLAGCAAPTAEVDEPLGQASGAEVLVEDEGSMGADQPHRPPVQCGVCRFCIHPDTGELSYDIPAPVIVTSKVMTLTLGKTSCTFSASGASAKVKAPCSGLDSSADTGTLYFESNNGPMFVTFKSDADAIPADL